MTSTVTVRRRIGLTNIVSARHHDVLADEPAENGGGDAGPTPWELLLSAMGACTAITVELYADRKGWPLDDLAIHLTREPDSQCVRIEIEVFGNLSEEQRERLAAVAQHCPVVKAVSGGLDVEESLKVVAR